MCKRIMIVDDVLRRLFHRLGRHIGISPGKKYRKIIIFKVFEKNINNFEGSSYMRNVNINFCFTGYYLIVPALLTALAASGFQRITYEADPEYLFSPINGHSKLERKALEKHFPMNYSEFDAGQQHINNNSLLQHGFYRLT